jgi:hypothetical protein
MNRMNNRSQVQMGETVAIVVIVIVLLMVGIVFWSNIRKLDVQKIDRTTEELSVIELSKIVSELPELRCYNANIVTKINCFDYYKLLAFNRTINNEADPLYLQTQRMYSGYFRNSRITFRQVYPEDMSITIYDENISAQRSLQIMIPIVIEHRLDRTGTNAFGMIIVEGYYR